MMRQLSFRALVSILTFTLGIMGVALWSIRQFGDSARPASSADGRQKPSVQPEWNKIDMDGKATFYVPADLRTVVLYASSPYRAFRREGMDIAMFYPNIRVGGTCIDHNEENLSKYKVSRTKVAGRDATILTLEVAVFGDQDIHDSEPLKGMTICVPDMGDGEHEFSILARYKNEQDYQDIQRIIDSIQFH
jgi:hypothetical protein